MGRVGLLVPCEGSVDIVKSKDHESRVALKQVS